MKILNIMPEKFDFSTEKGRKKFRTTTRQDKIDEISEKQDTANKMQELIYEDASPKDYNAAFDLVDEQKTKEREALLADFDTYIKDKIDLLPEGCLLASELEGVESVRIDKPANSKTQFHVGLNYNAIVRGKQKPRSFSFTITNNGEARGITGADRPKELEHLTSNEILREIVDDFKKLNLGARWIKIKGFNLPPGPWSREQAGENPRPTQEAPQDLDRLEFFGKHPACLLKLYPEIEVRKKEGKGGLSEYAIFLYPRGVIFENAYCENRIYYFIFESPIPPDFMEKIQRNSFSAAELEAFLDAWDINENRMKSKIVLMSEGKRYGSDHPDFDPNVSESKEKNEWWKEVKSFIDKDFA